MDPALPATLNQAMATEPLWLQAWVLLLVVANLGALVFVAGRDEGRWFLRPEPPAILLSFVAAAVLMGWIYDQVGYVRLLGIAHLLCWGPVYAWVLSRWRGIERASPFGRYIAFYLVIAGTSLLIDALDLVRYLLGDAELLHRWS